jgi:hypothetical protein
LHGNNAQGDKLKTYNNRIRTMKSRERVVRSNPLIRDL